MRLMDLGERFILYITEQSILIPTSSLLEYAVNVKATLLTFFLFYSTNFGAGIKAIFETRAGMLDLLILFLISLAYYSIESVTGFRHSQVHIQEGDNIKIRNAQERTA